MAERVLRDHFGCVFLITKTRISFVNSRCFLEISHFEVKFGEFIRIYLAGTQKKCFPCHRSNKKLQKPNKTHNSNGKMRKPEAKKKTNRASSTNYFLRHRSDKKYESPLGDPESATRTQKLRKPNTKQDNLTARAQRNNFPVTTAPKKTAKAQLQQKTA
jgi:hypothetical protein